MFYHLLVVFVYLFLPYLCWDLVGISKTENQKQTAVVQAARKATQEFTNSLMMSRAKYVGGHPLIAETQSVVIGLSDSSFTIYGFIKPKSDFIQLKVSILLSSIEKARTGRPRTAHEIFDEDDRRVIDVVEDLPFLQLGFQLDGQKYAVSLSDFEIGSPTDWSNRIISLRHAILTSQDGENHQS